jgi:hypothetical protein
LSSTAADKITSSAAAHISGNNTINITLVTGPRPDQRKLHVVARGQRVWDRRTSAYGTTPAGFSNFNLNTSTATDLILSRDRQRDAGHRVLERRAAAVAGQGNAWGAGPSIGTSNWATNLAGTVDAKQVPGGKHRRHLHRHQRRGQPFAQHQSATALMPSRA